MPMASRGCAFPSEAKTMITQHHVHLKDAHKTGQFLPAVAAGKNGAVAYTFEQGCGTLSGTVTATGKTVEFREKTCQDL